LIGKSEEKATIWKIQQRLAEYHYRNLKETGYDDVDWIRLAQNRECQALVNTAMDPRIPYDSSNFFSILVTISFSKVAQIRGVVAELIKPE
jgi:hypothetical protein